MRLEALGEQAWMATYDREDDASAFAWFVREAKPAWVVDVVQAYASVAVFYDARCIDPALTREMVVQLAGECASRTAPATERIHEIPCCYEMGLDLDRVADTIGLGREQIISLHTGTVYQVYAIGFCPGFPYLGYLPNALTGVPRLPSPRVRVEAGSVGLTGRQTGIYTEVRPGGWNIVGRTPLTLVDVVDNYFPLHTGDRLRFVRIDSSEFAKRLGQRL